MSQLFTVYFPNYYFDLQKEFSISFKYPLPFEYDVIDGICYVGKVYYDKSNENDPYYWHKKGLQQGLRIIYINNTSLIDNNNDDNGPLNNEKIQDLLINSVNDNIEIQFREEVSPEDYSIPLGLKYNNNNDNDIKIEDKSNQSLLKAAPADSHSKAAQSTSLIVKNNNRDIEIITDNQIGASSFKKGYEPSECRLNNPYSCWEPSQNDQTTLDTWIRIDLGMKKMITKIHIQGSPDNTSYLKTFWIDYSDDCCQWVSHELGEIKCKYKNYGSNDDKNIYAKVIIWPAITARFIRIRPFSVHNKVSLRFELYGFKEIVNTANLQFARVVTLSDVNESDKNKLIERVTNLPVNTKVIQVDCRAVIRAALDRAGIISAGFLKSDADNYICVFTTSDAKYSQDALDELADVGVGREMGIISTTSIAFRNEPTHKKGNGNNKNNKNKNKKDGPSFAASVKSRMVVEQVVERIMNSSAFTFDYICMLVVASLIAAGGLATDNSVIVVASMLVSPLMGPVLAFTFGVTLKEMNMASLGLKNELLSLIICVITGFIVGFFYAVLSRNVNNWPTLQMSSRGQTAGLADGAFIAAASGVGVALSVLGDYLSTVVGVAISASLLPPAVNCGMLFGFIIYLEFEVFQSQNLYKDSINYSDINDLLSMGGLSLLLTIENIIIIFGVGRFMFWIKDVYISKDHHEKIWKSVTNFKHKYSKMSNGHQTVSMAAVKHQTVKYQNENINDKVKRSIQSTWDHDFETASNTLKGRLMMNRQSSNRLFVNTSSLHTHIAEYNNIESLRNTQHSINLSVITTGDIDIDKSSTKTKSKINLLKKNTSNSTDTDSDKSDYEQDNGKKSHVNISELFTPEKIAMIKTPQTDKDPDDFNYNNIELKKINDAFNDNNIPSTKL